MNSTECTACGFALWRPIAELSHSNLGLYSDARFPGRSILSLMDHYDHLDEVPPDTLFGFIMDMRRAAAAIKTITGAERVNSAILGNQEGHVHAHLIPRKPELEPRPHKAPWEDTRERAALEVVEEARLIREIGFQLERDGGATKFPIPRTADYIARRNQRETVRAAATDIPLFDILSDLPANPRRKIRG